MIEAFLPWAEKAGSSALYWVIRKFKRPDPADVVRKRVALKEECERRLPNRNRDGSRGAAVIRDVKRSGSYPGVDEKGRGASPWFKVELKDVYHKGIEAFIHTIDYYVQDTRTEKWHRAKQSEVTVSTKGWLIARISFDLIEEIDWDGDEYYRMPHFYCRFPRHGRGLFEELLVYEERGEYFCKLGVFSSGSRKHQES